VEQNPQKPTFEVRILPSWLEAAPIIEAAALLEAILAWCVDPSPRRKNIPGDLGRLFPHLFARESDVQFWKQKYLAAAATAA
jgi:hypothetical protein